MVSVPPPAGTHVCGGRSSKQHRPPPPQRLAAAERQRRRRSPDPSVTACPALIVNPFSTVIVIAVGHRQVRPQRHTVQRRAVERGRRQHSRRSPPSPSANNRPGQPDRPGRQPSSASVCSGVGRVLVSTVVPPVLSRLPSCAVVNVRREHPGRHLDRPAAVVPRATQRQRPAVGLQRPGIGPRPVVGHRHRAATTLGTDQSLFDQPLPALAVPTAPPPLLLRLLTVILLP